jgi:hypothetical protein
VVSARNTYTPEASLQFTLRVGIAIQERMVVGRE